LRARWQQACVSLLTASVLQSCYVAHLARGQLELVNNQVPLRKAVENEADPVRRALLAEVPLITWFAVHVVRMAPSESYVGYYEVADREWLTLVLSAAPRDSLEPITRWYPFAGRVPYRSYFDEARAKRAQAELEAEGLDTYLHESPAYSTLGFFRDPITTPMLDSSLSCPVADKPDAVDPCRIAALAETLLHELTHQYRYVPGDTDFNEQLASFVGRTAAIQYLRYRGMYDEALGARLLEAYAKQEQYADQVILAAHELEAIYASDAPLTAKLARREPIFQKLTDTARAMFPGREVMKTPMNNARILQYLRYDRSADTFAPLWKSSGQSWADFWYEVDTMKRPTIEAP
jgi:predicted aminopeptidase